MAEDLRLVELYSRRSFLVPIHLYMGPTNSVPYATVQRSPAGHP